MSTVGRWAVPQLEALAAVLRTLHPDDRALLATIESGTSGGGSPRTVDAGGLVDASAIAARFGVTAAWVRSNADRLGAVRLGTGARPRLRFDPAKVDAELTAGVGSRGSHEPISPLRRRMRRRREYRTGTGVELLPIRGEEAPFGDEGA
jgi:hypothetical protein